MIRMSEQNVAPGGIDTWTPNVARIYDYLLGGKDNFVADRQFSDQLLAAYPIVAWIARQNRAFVDRAVRYCAGQGVDQFLDVGSGLPTMDNVHEVARRVIPGAAVVYVDNDPVAFAHAAALLATSDGVAALRGDAREPGKILAEVSGRGLIDLNRPLVVLLTAILHFIPDEDDPAGIIEVFRDAMPSGSYLVLSHGAYDSVQEGPVRAHAAGMFRGASSPLITRSRQDVAAMLAGLELVEPGLVAVTQWRPAYPPEPQDRAYLYAAVGHKA
jgi:hypothetical protein